MWADQRDKVYFIKNAVWNLRGVKRHSNLGAMRLNSLTGLIYMAKNKIPLEKLYKVPRATYVHTYVATYVTWL